MGSANKQEQHRWQPCANCRLGICFEGPWKQYISVMLPFWLPFSECIKNDQHESQHLWKCQYLYVLMFDILGSQWLQSLSGNMKREHSVSTYYLPGAFLSIISLILPTTLQSQNCYYFCMWDKSYWDTESNLPPVIHIANVRMLSLFMEHPVCAGDVRVPNTPMAID